MPVTRNKINTSNYNFVSIDGQYMLGALVHTKAENECINIFDREEDLISYVDVSKVGFDLPAVELVFSTSDADLIPYLCENSIFDIEVGSANKDIISSTFNVVTANIQQKSAGKWLVRLVGVYNAIDYLKNPKTKMHANYSTEIVKEVMQSALGSSMSSSVMGKSKDHMFWLQSNESDYQFLHKLWLHSYLPDSIWLTAVCFDGKLKMIDLRKQTKIIPEVMLTTGNYERKSKIYPILDNYEVIDNSAVNNSLGGGYAQSRPLFDMDQNRKDTVQKKGSVVISPSDTYNREPNTTGQASYLIKNENVHSNYHVAPLNNRNMLSALKSFILEVTVEGEFVPVELLDYVMVKDQQQDSQASYHYSGVYMVGKIAHQISNKRLYTHLTLWRESQSKVASPSTAADIKSMEAKFVEFQAKVDSSSSTMTTDSYNSIMDSFSKLRQKLADAENKARKAVTDTAAYQALRELEKKYNQLQNYIYNVYNLSSAFLALTPYMDEVQEALSKITVNSPTYQIESAIYQYTNLQKYMNQLEQRVKNEVNSTSVYSQYQDAKIEYNKLGRIIGTLQTAGIIGDLSEYTQFDGS